MQNLKTKTSEPKLYSFIVSPENLQFKKDAIQFTLDPKIIPQSTCNVIAYDLDSAGVYMKGIIQGKPLQAKYTNVETLSDFLKLTEQFMEVPVSLPTMITSPPPVEVPVKASAENWIAYLRDEAGKVGYKMIKINKK